MKLEDAVVEHAKSSGRLQVAWVATIVSGDQQGRKLFWRDGIEDDESRAFFRGKLARLGIEWPAKASELPDALQQAVDSYADVTVKNKNDFTNVYFNRAIDSADVDPSVTEEQPEEPKEPENSDEVQASATFDDDKLTPPQRTQIKKLAVLDEMDPDRYNSLTDLMLDLAESKGISGEFDDPAKLLKAIASA